MEEFEELREAARTLYNEMEAFDYVFGVARDRVADSGEWPTGATIDAAYIGEMYSLNRALQIDSGEIAKFVRRFDEHLEHLDSYRNDTGMRPNDA